MFFIFVFTQNNLTLSYPEKSLFIMNKKKAIVAKITRWLSYLLLK